MNAGATAVVVGPRSRSDGGGPVVRRDVNAVALLTIAAAAVLLAVPAVTTSLAGEMPYQRIHAGYPGADIAIGTTISRSLADAAAIVTVGALAALLFLRDVFAARAQDLGDQFELRVLRMSAAVWSIAAAASVMFELFDANGVRPSELSAGGAAIAAQPGLADLIPSLFEASSLAWTVSFVGSGLVAISSWFVERWTGLLIPLWAACVAVLAPVAVGQILVGPGHDLGSDAGYFQTLAVAVGLGTVLVSAIRLASGRFLPIATLRRRFLICAVALSVVLVTDPVLARFKLQGEGAWESPTAWQVYARGAVTVTLLSLAITAWALWRVGRLTDKGITRIVGAAALAAALWIGITVAMDRIPPPQYFVPTSIPQNFLGFDVDAAPTALVLFTHWRPNLLLSGLAVAGVGLYLLAVRTLHRRGDRWPAGRTFSWVVGWSVVVVASGSGFGKYSAADFGIHMVVHMSLNMLAPLLLVLGGVVTLVMRATQAGGERAAGLHEWTTSVLHWRVLRFVYNPLLVFAVFIGSYYGLYFSGLFEAMVRYHWAHQLMNLHFLAVGYLYYGLVIGVDRPPRPLPHVGKLGFVLAAMPFHAFFGVILMSSSLIVAENFYRTLDLPWADLAASQYLAGGVAWAAGELPLMIVVVVLGIQWARQDAKEAKRKDRHLDSGLDDEFEEYNRMLERLASRESVQPGQPAKTPQLKETHG
ncbi:cytochrome c oxidase assembly protein [Promicromonospora alba]|uniref:Cytochrome c oxidase assembly protein n=1 Tax=Promicromonospora alba TaxID=1616110 RepID=A0ABV9HAQ3_9MICO